MPICIHGMDTALSCVQCLSSTIKQMDTVNSKLTCSCGKEITSPKLTGDFCITCYRANKTVTIVSEPAILDTPIQEDKIPEGLKFKATPVINPVRATITICNDCGSEDHETGKCPVVHAPSKSLEQKDPSKVYCQSCIERGYGLQLATRVWQEGEPICEDCFQPLLKNMLSYNTSIEDIQNKVVPFLKTDSPFLTQAYDLLGIPEYLRIAKSDIILDNRNKIWNHHSESLMNKTQEQILARHEELTAILFQIKIELEPIEDYINRIKSAERSKAGLKSIEKAEKTITKRPSLTKMSKDEKMAKQLGMPLETYLKMAAEARKSEFNKVIGAK